MYKVLWVDDEFATLELISESATENDIDLIGVTNAEEALEMLRAPQKFDAVLLDGLFLKDKNDTSTPSSDTPFGDVAKRLNELKAQGVILPWFILSGKTKFTLDQNSLVDVFAEGKVFDKNKPADIRELWEAIKSATSDLPNTKLRHQYARVFEVCTEKYIGEYAGQDLLTILKNVDDGNVEQYFNTVRKIVEDLFRAFNKCELLPDEFVDPTVALNESSRFLQGKDHKGEYQIVKGYTHKEGTHLPQLISSSLWSILTTVQDASHRALIDDHIKALKTPYLLQSVVFGLLDVIVWFKQYIDSNPQRNNWIRLEGNTAMQNSSGGWISGEVYEIKDSGWGSFCSECGKYQLGIPNFIVRKNGLTSGVLVKITLKADNNKYIDKIVKQ